MNIPLTDPDDENGLLLEDYPQLRAISWHLQPGVRISGRDALLLYERNWNHVNASQLSENEKQLIAWLVQTVGNGVFHV